MTQPNVPSRYWPAMYGRSFYEHVADAVTGFLPPSLRNFERYRTSANLKVWYGDGGKEHYEVQVVKYGPKRLDLGLEIGFHAEHKEAARNDEVVALLVKAEKKWRAKLGKQPEVGGFIGDRFPAWRRISEVWVGVSDDPGVAVDAAERLATYITTFEPIRTKPDSLGAAPPARRRSS